MTLTHDYKYLLEKKHFTEEEILCKAESLYTQCANFLLKSKKTNKKLYIHEGKLQKLVYDYFVGIARLKDYHEIECESPRRQAAYTAFGVMRHAPIQISDNSESMMFPNEMFAVSLLFTECQNLLGGNLSESQKNTLIEFGKDVHYFFRFRHYSQQSIEIVLDAFMYGIKATTKKITT